MEIKHPMRAVGYGEIEPGHLFYAWMMGRMRFGMRATVEKEREPVCVVLRPGVVKTKGQPATPGVVKPPMPDGLVAPLVAAFIALPALPDDFEVAEANLPMGAVACREDGSTFLVISSPDAKFDRALLNLAVGAIVYPAAGGRFSVFKSWSIRMREDPASFELPGQRPKD